jgi:hypothetical protein
MMPKFPLMRHGGMVTEANVIIITLIISYLIIFKTKKGVEKNDLINVIQ